ncbi:MAG: hypothetical protein ACK5RL_02235 [Acidimicrobiales bacterium]
MSEFQDSWKNVMSKVESIGLKIKLHLAQEEGTAEAGDRPDPSTVKPAPAGPTADNGPTGGDGSSGTGTADPSEDAGGGGSSRFGVDDLGDRIQDAFDAFGNAAKDPAVRADLKDLGSLLKSAVSETFASVGTEVSDRVDQVKRNRGDDSTAGSGAGPTDAASAADAPTEGGPATEGPSASDDPPSS